MSGISGPRYSAEHKDGAKKINQPLFTLDIDERHVLVNGKRKGRRHTIQGVLNPGWEPVIRAADKVTFYGSPDRPTGERDFEALPYHELEARVAGYLVELTGIGSGDDPVGFLIAAHRDLLARFREQQ